MTCVNMVQVKFNEINNNINICNFLFYYLDNEYFKIYK
jgi:hypothetical protein